MKTTTSTNALQRQKQPLLPVVMVFSSVAHHLQINVTNVFFHRLKVCCLQREDVHGAPPTGRHPTPRGPASRDAGGVVPGRGLLRTQGAPGGPWGRKGNVHGEFMLHLLAIHSLSSTSSN